MPFIGPVYCVTMLGASFPAPSERVKVWQRPGIDGYGLARLGKANTELVITVTHFGTSYSCNQWRDNLAVLIGTRVRLTNAFGETHSDTFLEKIQRYQKMRIVDPENGHTHRAEMRLRLILL